MGNRRGCMIKFNCYYIKVYQDNTMNQKIDNTHPKISILIVSFNSSEFIEVSLEALEKLTNNPYKVYIIDNGSKIEDYDNLKKIVSNYDNVDLERNETDLRGSMAHGTALNSLVKKVDTQYFSILDADATWLKKDWDKILIGMMNESVKVIGTQAPLAKPQDFPLMFCILFETESFNKLNIDFRPTDIAKFQDTGYEIREKYLEAKLQGLNIGVKYTREYKKGPFKEIISDEYYLNDDYSNIFAAHFGRGSTMGVHKHKKGIKKYFYQIPLVGQFCLARKAKNEKNTWIGICRYIINEQANNE